MLKLKNNYYILRHGQTDWQTKKKEWTYPKSDSPKIKLTKKGEKQIKKAVEKVRGKKVDLIFSSDFFRARQTSKIVAKALGLKVNFDKRLRDINLGIYKGRTKEEFYAKFPRYSKNRFQKSPPGGENWLEVKKRMLQAIKGVEKKNKSKTILIVSHAEPLWLLEGAVKNWSLTEFLKNRKNNYIEIAELRKLHGA